uniref:F-box domain-containing protein n=1 Tax=Rhizophagus irregularis (strain DAOM 181602 / DAOM 197198 / MUCL 43194) TaxID=747089 RepID=U9UMQ7_RHIID
MSKLNRDVLYLIFEEFQDDDNTLHSCLLVNKTWCEIIIPILWKNPWKNLKREKEKSLLNVIISHLSGESKNNLKNLGINFLENLYQKPLFNYISFCRHLNLFKVKTIINAIDKDSEKIIIKNDIFSLFINEHTRFTHLYIPFQVFLIPGTKCCFSEIEFLSCNTSVNDNILVELTEICKSIKELELIIEVQNNNYQIIKLIKTQKKLFSVSFLIDYLYNNTDETFRILLENSLIRHANTIQYFKATRQPATQILSSFVNLRILELDCISIDTWNCLENLSLPFLQILKANQVPIKALTRLIENTSGFLIEINIDYKNHDELSNKRIIQVIYQNCPYLKYLKIMLINSNILELENLLINCQHLDGLFIIIYNTIGNIFNWNNLFEILTKSSPITLFKFKFSFYPSYRQIKFESLKLFFDNWKERYPMLLQFSQIGGNMDDLIEVYKVKGIVKKYDNYLYGKDFEF